MCNHYNTFRQELADCISEGYLSFDKCPPGSQELMAYHYWLSSDDASKAKFLLFIEGNLMDVAAGERVFSQSDMEDALIEFYKDDIEFIFKHTDRRAA